jgi:hypothetical protein
VAGKAIEIPGDWTVFLSDVVGSTKAITEGRYKEVNTAGSLPVMAIANLVGDMSFPFAFGGDGMTAVLRITAARIVLRWRLPLKHDGQMLREIRENNRLSSDVRKFDGSLKMIASAAAAALDALEKELAGEEARGRIVYGIHRSDRAHMTCMIHTESSGEVHFVDGTDGGYALAAKMMKEKLALR